MFDMTKETGAFHNIYKTGIGAETEKEYCMKETSQAKERCGVLRWLLAFKLPITI